MATDDSTRFLAALNSFLPAQVVDLAARKTGWVARQRCFEPGLFIWTLLLGFSACSTRSLSALHRAYQRHTGCTACYSAFYQRLNDRLLAALRALFEGVAARGGGGMAGFEDILLLDATILRLWRGLRQPFASTAPGQAAAKLHVVMSLAALSPERVKIRPGREHDVTAWRGIGAWVRGRLLIADLGFYSFWLFHRIHAHGGHFLSRLKSSCALTIVEDRARGAGRRAALVGLPLREALGRMRRQRFEFVVEVPVTLRSGRVVRYRWRALGQYNQETGRYHTYLTNAPAALIDADEVGELYALRWQIELLFKGLQQSGRLHELPTRSETIATILIYAALIWVALAGWLRQTIIPREERAGAGVLRLVRTLREWGEHLLGELARHHLGAPPPDLFERFRAQCQDRNAYRERALTIAPILEHPCASLA